MHTWRSRAALGKSLASLGLEVNICKINHQGPSVWCGGPWAEFGKHKRAITLWFRCRARIPPLCFKKHLICITFFSLFILRQMCSSYFKKQQKWLIHNNLQNSEVRTKPVITTPPPRRGFCLYFLTSFLQIQGSCKSVIKAKVSHLNREASPDRSGHHGGGE